MVFLIARRMQVLIEAAEGSCRGCDDNRLRACEKICCARDLALHPRRAKQGHSLALASRRCSESSCISTYTPGARPILGTHPFGACAPFRSRRNGPALRRNATSLRSRRFFHKLSALGLQLVREPVQGGVLEFRTLQHLQGRSCRLGLRRGEGRLEQDARIPWLALHGPIRLG
jgi:hypothetical protein